MQELEKILEEIDCRFENLLITDDECRKTALSKHDYEKAKYYRTGIVFTERAMDIVKDIIRNHMNDGWIPVEKQLPDVTEGTEDPDCPEFNVMIKGASRSTTLKYSWDGTWFDDNGYLYDVIAWQPLPEPYRPERSEGE